MTAPISARAAGNATQSLVLAAFLPTFLLIWILWAAPLSDLPADRHALAARDFTVFWTAGHLARASAFESLYGPASLTAYLRSVFGPGMPAQIWPYPPSTLLLAFPISSFPFMTGLVVLTTAGLSLLGCSLFTLRLSWQAKVAVMLSPAVSDCCLTGQISLVVTAALIAGLALVDTKPFISGVVLGCLCLKPQFGLLVPAVILARGSGRMTVGFVISVLFACLLPIVFFGPASWERYNDLARGAATAYLEAPFRADGPQSNLVSVFMALRSVGATLTSAYVGQVAVSAACFGLVWAAWRHPLLAPAETIAITLVGTVCSSPWIHGYDTVPVAVSIALLWSSSSTRQRAMLGVQWACPTIATLTGTNIILGCVPLFAVFLVACRLRFTRPRCCSHPEPLCA